MQVKAKSRNESRATRRGPVALAHITALFAAATLACSARPTSQGDRIHHGRDAHTADRSPTAPRPDIHRAAGRGPGPVRIQILGINDFHGHLSTTHTVKGRSVGGAAVLAAHLRAEQRAFKGISFIVHAGDQVGASPPVSALLQDEPSIAFLNLLGNRFCTYENRDHPRCDVIGTLGNHEFDEGVTELLRLLHGGDHAFGPYLETPYHGATFSYVSANVIDQRTGRPLLAPSAVRDADGVSVGFIGAVLKGTPSVVEAGGVQGVSFLDEAEAINAQVAELRDRGVEALVVLIHQGEAQPAYQGSTRPDVAGPRGPIAEIVQRLDGAVDVVISGHAHAFTNALLENREGRPTLVTQAYAEGTAYGDIELTIDRRTRDVVERSAAIVTTFADSVTPEPAVAALVASAEDAVATQADRIVGRAAHPLSRKPNADGESVLGDLIADAQRAATDTDFAFMNLGGIRTDLPAGEVTWGDLFAIHPFGNRLVHIDLTGRQVRALLEQQWQGQPHTRILQVSGLRYRWDPEQPEGRRVVELRLPDGTRLHSQAMYSVTANSFIASGGDRFTIFEQGTRRTAGPTDLEALVHYIQSFDAPFSAPAGGRIRRTHPADP